MKQTNKITIKADGYRLVPDWAVVGTEGSYGVSALAFEFGDAWDGLVRRVTFFPANGSDAIEVMAEGTDVVVPPEVMSVAGTAEYVLDGTRDGVRLISLCGRLRVLQTKEPGGADPAEPTQDVYSQILAISTIAAIVTASVALLMMNFSRSGRTVDESRSWLKRIIITWVILNGLGFIMAYITPFFAGGQWTPTNP